MSSQEYFVQVLQDRFQSVLNVKSPEVVGDMPQADVPVNHLLTVCETLKNDSAFDFNLLLDVCGVDYMDYGVSEWRTSDTTNTGFDRGVRKDAFEQMRPWNKPRFGVTYHFLSLTHNRRLRLKVYVDGEPPLVPSLVNIWPAADWYEREAFDLFGIIFDGHPDLRRLLTDYGFVGHPFRKDFPLIGEVELRYDAAKKRCVYEPVSIQARTLVPKVIRSDNRYKK